MCTKKLFFCFFSAALLLLAGCEKDKSTKTPVVVVTNDVTNITSTAPAQVSATVSGGVDVVGGETISERGVCWSTDPNPTPAGNKAVAGTGVGTFNADLAGLTFGSTYYARAYAISNGATYYGNNIKFVASAPIPLIKNGDFETPGDGGALVNSLYWQTDEVDAGVLGKGTDDRNPSNYIWTYNLSKSFYQVVGAVPNEASDYAISFDGNYDWTDWGAFNTDISVTFSAYSGSDPVTRQAIGSVTIPTGDFPGWGNNWTRKSGTFSIPAGSAFAGQNLVIEFDISPYVDPTSGSISDNTVWYQFDNVSVVQTIK